MTDTPKYPWLVLPQVMETLFKASDELLKITRMFGAEDAPRYVRDFRTIRLNYGQRTGKTQYVRDAAAEDDLIIVYDEDTKNWYTEGESIKSQIVTIHQLLAALEGGKKWPTCHPRIWVDDWVRLCHSFENPRLQTWEQQLQFYQGLVHVVDQQFIIFG